MKRTVRPFSRMTARGLIAAGASLVLLASTAGAIAQQPGATPQGPAQLEPPRPNPPLTAPSHPLQMAIGILLLVLVIGANMIPSKRGHQD